MRRIVTLVTVLMLVTTAHIPATAQDDFSKLMTVINYHYTMGLYTTSQGDSRAAVEHVSALAKTWDTLLLSYADVPPAQFAYDPAWAGDVADIAGAVHVGMLHTQAGRLKTAHEDLERVRVILRDLRERNKVPELADRLTTFHERMETSFITATDPKEVKSAVWDIKQIFPDLKDAWNAATRSYESLPDSDVKTGLKGSFADLQSAVDALESDLSAGDPEAVLKSAKALKPSFMRLFLAQAQLPYAALRAVESADK